MTQELWTRVDRYITDLLVPPDPVLDAALEGSASGRILELIAQLETEGWL